MECQDNFVKQYLKKCPDYSGHHRFIHIASVLVGNFLWRKKTLYFVQKAFTLRQIIKSL